MKITKILVLQLMLAGVLLGLSACMASAPIQTYSNGMPVNPK